MPLLFKLHEIRSVDSQKKIIEIVATMSDFKAKMHQIQFRLGLRPRPRWEAYSTSPDPLTGFKGPTSKGREGREGKGGQGWGGERGRMGREGKDGEGDGEGRGKGEGMWRGPESGLSRGPRWLSAGLTADFARIPLRGADTWRI